MRAQKGGHSTHSTVQGGPGYFPTGYSTGGSYEFKINKEVNNQSTDNFLNPGWEGSKVSHFTSTKKRVSDSVAKDIRDNFYERFKPAPGVYASTQWGHFEEGNAGDRRSALHQTNGQDYEFPQDFLAAAGVLDLQHNTASAPHQWLSPIVELDKSEEKLQDYFADISSEALRDKVEILREEGYSEEEIAMAISKAREADILRKFKNPSSVIRKSAHAFADVQIPYLVQAEKGSVRYPEAVNMSYLRARGNRFGPVASRGHLMGDEKPRLSEVEYETDYARVDAKQEAKRQALMARMAGSAEGLLRARGRPVETLKPLTQQQITDLQRKRGLPIEVMVAARKALREPIKELIPRHS
jgi:hypothetical protein